MAQLFTNTVDLIEGDVDQNSGQICVRILSNITLIQRTVAVTASVTSMSDNVGNIESEFDVRLSIGMIEKGVVTW